MVCKNYGRLRNLNKHGDTQIRMTFYNYRVFKLHCPLPFIVYVFMVYVFMMILLNLTSVTIGAYTKRQGVRGADRNQFHSREILSALN